MAGTTPNPKKRGYLLPPGCKDLHDVLQRRDRRKNNLATKSCEGVAAALSAFDIKRGDPIQGPLSDLERYVVMVAESNAFTRTLTLVSLDFQFHMSIHQGEGLPMEASLAVEIGTEQEKAMQAFCVRHVLPQPDDTKPSAGFLPHLPVSQIYRLSPLPAEAPQAAKLILELCREVGGLDNHTTVYFRYEEVVKTV